MLKKYNIESYKDFIQKFVIDECIRKEIIGQIDRFYKEGLIIICGKEFCGKIRDIEHEDYLEIKYIDDCLICNYTKNNFRKVVNIIQNRLKDNIKIDRKESLECPSLGNHNEIFEQQKIYYDNKLIYESLITNNQDYNIENGTTHYNDKGFLFNGFNLMKKWYFPNKSIVYYRLKKNYCGVNCNLKEDYLICLEPYLKNYNMVYDYDVLDVELFNKLMLGQISIEEVVELINIQKVKKLNGGV